MKGISFVKILCYNYGENTRNKEEKIMKNKTKQLKKGAVGVLAASLVLTPVVLNAKQVHAVYATAGSIAVTDAKVTLGEAFDAMKGVKGTDSVGNDATGSIKVSGNVDTQSEGKYTLVYEMTSATGEKVTATRVVTVEKPIVNTVVEPKSGDVKIVVAKNLIKQKTYDVNTSEFNFAEGVELAFISMDTNKEVGRLTTTGKADILNMPYGKYKVEALSVPEFFTLEGVPNHLEFEVDQATGNGFILAVSDANEGHFVTPYIEVGDQTEYVNGVEFEVKDSTGTVVYSYVSDEKDRAFSLEGGEYTMTLTKLPAGYKLAAGTERTIRLTKSRGGCNAYAFRLEKEVPTQPKAPQATNNQKDDTRLPDTGGKKAKFFPWF